MGDLSNYNRLREEAQSFYNSLSPIFSPALNEKIYFTTEGFKHILFIRTRDKRDKSSQSTRFKMLGRANKLLTISTTYQEYEETRHEFEVKRYKKRIRIYKFVRYWGIIAIIDNRKIKVVVRKIGDGQMHFWSIIPAWITSKHRDAKFFSTMKGNPEED